MTQVARRVLDDARFALNLLEDAEPGQDFRVKWVAAVALLRAVGHVLTKVDSLQSPELRDAIAGAWDRWKVRPEKHSIFWSFIERERNNVLKEYVHGYDEGPFLVIYDDQEYELEPGHWTQVTDGIFEGEDARAAYSYALDWWREQLDVIDKEAAKRTG